MSTERPKQAETGLVVAGGGQFAPPGPSPLGDLLRGQLAAPPGQTFDLAGAVTATHVPVSRPLLPLFEAISNSIYALGEGGSGGAIRVKVLRDPRQTEFAFEGRTGQAGTIIGFTVTDDGVGFDERHIRSFQTLYSPLKKLSGGKGIGRYTWFKAFSVVEITSHYVSPTGIKARRWKYMDGDAELRAWEDVPATRSTAGSEVTLRGMRAEYEARCPKGVDTIAYRIVDHFLVLHVLQALPKIFVEGDGDEGVFEANSIYQDVIVRSERIQCRVLDTHDFTVHLLMLRHHAELPGAIAYCAGGRAVDEHDPDTVIADVPKSFAGPDGRLLSFRAYVSGKLLEDHHDSFRSVFYFDKGARGQRVLYPDRPSWVNIQEALQPACETFIKNEIAAARVGRDEKVERHLENAPWYRSVLAARPEVKGKIPVTSGEQAIEMALYKATLDWRVEVFERGAQLLDELKSEGADFDALREKLWTHQETLKTEALGDLTRYIHHRRAVLQFLENYLSHIGGTKAHVQEKVVHDLFFRRGTDSTTTGYFSHNLWVLDDQLTFHHYAASDLALSAHRGHKRKSRKEPDVAVYSRAIFTERDDEQALCTSVVIIEFKKPGRHAFGTDDDPVQQVRNYADLIHTGTAKTDDGKTIEVGEGTRYFGYVIADPSRDLNEIVKHYGMRQLPNGSGWAHSFSGDDSEIYVEMLTYTQALVMAKRRNAAFFHLLGVRGKLTP